MPMEKMQIKLLYIIVRLLAVLAMSLCKHDYNYDEAMKLVEDIS